MRKKAVKGKRKGSKAKITMGTYKKRPKKKR
jgi:hypothetical protein